MGTASNSYSPNEVRGPVTDGELISEELSLAYERTYISVIFYSDEFATPVIPTAGTLTCTASETGDGYGTVPDGSIDVTTEQYTRPAFQGPAKHIKFVASGITGAVNYIALIHRYTSGR